MDTRNGGVCNTVLAPWSWLCVEASERFGTMGLLGSQNVTYGRSIFFCSIGLVPKHYKGASCGLASTSCRDGLRGVSVAKTKEKKMENMYHGKRTVLIAVLMLMSLCIVTFPASASSVDFLFGPVAAPGSELLVLGTAAMEHSHEGATYFTNGKGRILEVRAKSCKDGALRVSVNRVYIPMNYNCSEQSEIHYQRLSQLAERKSAVKAGQYTLIDKSNGRDAYRYGEMIAKELDSE